MRIESLVCDFHNARTCVGDVTTLIIFTDGDRQATAVDLCQHHAAPVKKVFAKGTPVDLPTRPRARMEPTKLRTTGKTQRLKKRGHDGQKDESS